MGTKLGRALTYRDRLWLLKSHDPLWSRDNLKNYLHFHKIYDNWTQQGVNFGEEVQNANP